jgi:hypothetical protein
MEIYEPGLRLALHVPLLLATSVQRWGPGVGLEVEAAQPPCVRWRVPRLVLRVPFLLVLPHHVPGREPGGLTKCGRRPSSQQAAASASLSFRVPLLLVLPHHVLDVPGGPAGRPRVSQAGC